MAILLFTAIFGVITLYPDALMELGRHLQAGAFFLSNFQLYSESGYFANAAETKPLLHLWSLAIEEQFYLVWPVLLSIAFGWKRGIPIFAAGATIASLLINLYQSGHNPTADFYLLHCRLWELASGCLIHGFQNRQRNFFDSDLTQFSGLILLAWSAFGHHPQDQFPGWHALFPVVGTCLLLGGSESARINRGLLSSRFLQFFGTISFTLYLWHWPLIAFLRLLFLDGSAILAVALSLLLAWLTHRWIETPILKVPLTSRNRWRFIGFGAFALLIFAGAGIQIKRGVWKNHRLNPLPPLSDSRVGINCSMNANYGNAFSKDFYKKCEEIRYPGRPVILLIGDSHAGCLSDGVFELSESRKLNLFVETAMYCTPLSLLDKRPACRDYNEYIFKRVRYLHPDLVLLAANHISWGAGADYQEPLEYPRFLVSALQRMKSEGAKSVLLIGQNPTWQISLPRVINISFLAKGMSVPQRASEGLDRNSLEWDGKLRKAAQEGGVEYFSMADSLCNTEGCLIRTGTNLASDIVDIDYGHLSSHGSLWVARHGLGDRILNLISKN
jgi:peptidoglycan/LPS O-acetylase OafA/YrhL